MKIRRYGASEARKNLPRRKIRDNKTAGGKSLIVAGSTGLWGAAILSATAAARSGAGYVYLLSSMKNFPFRLAPDFLSARSFNDVAFDAIGLGPGLKTTSVTQKKIRELLRLKKENVVIDAGGLTALSKMKFQSPLPDSWILTPHEGELSRLLKIPSEKIRRNRLQAVRTAQKQFGGVILLKGHHTLIADGQNVFEIQSGNPALAKAGTGDVLTGMIVGFLSQKLAPTKAACLAAFVHGFIADQWLKNKKDPLSLMASDLLMEIPRAFSKLRDVN